MTLTACPTLTSANTATAGSNSGLSRAEKLRTAAPTFHRKCKNSARPSHYLSILPLCCPALRLKFSQNSHPSPASSPSSYCATKCLRSGAPIGRRRFHQFIPRFPSIAPNRFHFPFRSGCTIHFLFSCVNWIFSFHLCKSVDDCANCPPSLPRRVPHPSGLRVRVLTFPLNPQTSTFRPRSQAQPLGIRSQEKFVILSAAKDLNSNFKHRRVRRSAFRLRNP